LYDKKVSFLQKQVQDFIYHSVGIQRTNGQPTVFDKPKNQPKNHHRGSTELGLRATAENQKSGILLTAHVQVILFNSFLKSSPTRFWQYAFT
jgi:hypothetical protein